MSAGTITITAGRPNRDGDERDFAGPDGTYTFCAQPEGSYTVRDA